MCLVVNNGLILLILLERCVSIEVLHCTFCRAGRHVVASVVVVRCVLASTAADAVPLLLRLRSHARPADRQSPVSALRQRLPRDYRPVGNSGVKIQFVFQSGAAAAPPPTASAAGLPTTAGGRRRRSWLHVHVHQRTADGGYARADESDRAGRPVQRVPVDAGAQPGRAADADPDGHERRERAIRRRHDPEPDHADARQLPGAGGARAARHPRAHARVPRRPEAHRSVQSASDPTHLQTSAATRRRARSASRTSRWRRRCGVCRASTCSTSRASSSGSIRCGRSSSHNFHLQHDTCPICRANVVEEFQRNQQANPPPTGAHQPPPPQDPELD